MLAPTRGTCSLLDGELVESPPGSGRRVFLVFDAITYCDTRVGDMPLSRRLDCIGRKVRVPCKMADDARRASGRSQLPVREPCYYA